MLKPRREKGPILGWLDADYDAEPDVNVVHRYNECQVRDSYNIRLYPHSLHLRRFS